MGHLPNPKFERGAPYGQATAAVSKLRNARVAMISIKPPPVAAVKPEKKKRIGGCRLESDTWWAIGRAIRIDWDTWWAIWRAIGILGGQFGGQLGY